MTGRAEARTTGTELTVRADQVGWDAKQVAALRQLGITADVSLLDRAGSGHGHRCVRHDQPDQR